MIDKEIAIVMCYTGWSQETARKAIVQWRAVLPGWSAEHMKLFLSARALKKMAKLTSEATE